mgnify:CR=1 FL=1
MLVVLVVASSSYGYTLLCASCSVQCGLELLMWPRATVSQSTVAFIIVLLGVQDRFEQGCLDMMPKSQGIEATY